MRPWRDRWLSALLRLATTPSLADSILGDLEEGRKRRRKLPGSLWYCRELLGITAYIVVSTIPGLLASMRRSHGGTRGVWRDCRYAIRSASRAPWYALGVVLVTVLGMTLTSTVFAVVDGVLFRPLPYPAPSELYVAQGAFSEYPAAPPQLTSARDAREWAQAAPEAAFSLVGARPDIVWIRNNGADRTVLAQAVDAHFLEVLGVRPLIGGFTPKDFLGADPVQPVLVSFEFWRREFAADRAVLDRPLRLDLATNLKIRIVGVLPPSFVYPTSVAANVPDVLVPLLVAPDAVDNLRRRSFNVIARIPSGLSVGQVQQRLDVRALAIGNDFPQIFTRASLSAMAQRSLGPFDSVRLIPLKQHLGGLERQQFSVVFVTVCLLMLFACVNAAALVLARLADRQRELSVQRALGASRWRILRLVLVEIVILDTVAAMISLLLTRPVLSLATRLLPDSLLLLKTPVIDIRVLVFAGAVVCTSVVLVAILPLWSASRADLNPTLGASGLTTTRQLSCVSRKLIVPVQVTVGCLVLVAGTLVVASVMRVWHEDTGYDPDAVMLVDLTWKPTTSGDARDHLLAIRSALEQLPSVERVAAVAGQFLARRGGFDGVPFQLPDGAVPRGLTKKVSVTSGFFQVTRPRVIAGRLPADMELAAGDPVVVVSEEVARTYWPGRNAIGQNLRGEARLFTVIGVVADARLYALDRDSEGEIYVSAAALSDTPRTLLIKPRVGSTVLLSNVTGTIYGIWPDARVSRMVSMNEALGDSIRPRRFNAWLFGTFAVAALALLATGMLALVATRTARRTREIGIRMTLGATRGTVVGLLLKEEVSGVAAGLVAGCVASWWAVGFLKALVYKLSVYDLRVWATAILLILASAAIGVLVPAWLASRADPASVLRVE